MKKRRLVLVAFILTATLMIGVGYAAVSNVLDIQGSASVSQTAAEEEYNEDIYFSGVYDENSSSFVDNISDATLYGYTANINSNNNDKAQFTVSSLANKGDKVKITYQITNDSLHEATVTVKTNTNTNTTDFDFT